MFLVLPIFSLGTVAQEIMVAMDTTKTINMANTTVTPTRLMGMAKLATTLEINNRSRHTRKNRPIAENTAPEGIMTKKQANIQKLPATMGKVKLHVESQFRL